MGKILGKYIITYIMPLMLITAFAASMTGCASGSEDYKETTVSIDKKGRITHKIVESFDRDYYNEDELRNLIDKELSAYCSSRNDEKAAQLASLEIKDGLAEAEIDFGSCDDYAGFNEVDFFFGTVGEATDRDYPTDVTLKSADDDSTIGKYELESLKDNRIVVVSEPVTLVLPGKIAYYTANIDVIDKDRARMASDSVGLGYIVLK